MNDYEAVRRTISLYSQLMGQGRFEAFGELFTEDAMSSSIAESVNPVSCDGTVPKDFERVPPV